MDEFQKTLNSLVLGNHQHLLLEGFVRYLEELEQIPMTLLNRIRAKIQLQKMITIR